MTELIPFTSGVLFSSQDRLLPPTLCTTTYAPIQNPGNRTFRLLARYFLPQTQGWCVKQQSSHSKLNRTLLPVEQERAGLCLLVLQYQLHLLAQKFAIGAVTVHYQCHRGLFKLRLINGPRRHFKFLPGRERQWHPAKKTSGTPRRRKVPFFCPCAPAARTV